MAYPKHRSRRLMRSVKPISVIIFITRAIIRTMHGLSCTKKEPSLTLTKLLFFSFLGRNNFGKIKLKKNASCVLNIYRLYINTTCIISIYNIVYLITIIIIITNKYKEKKHSL